MRFRDMKTGAIYRCFGDVPCSGNCNKCPLASSRNGTYFNCADYVRLNPNEVEKIGATPIVDEPCEKPNRSFGQEPSTTDSDLDSIIKRYTLDCVRLLKSSISDTVLHAVEENEKLKEELEKLRKENSELRRRAWRQEIALKLSGKPNKPDKESNCVAYTTMKIQELSDQISSLMKETCEVKFK